MAEKLEAFPTRNRYTRYPWATWFDGSIWHLKSGVDYVGRDESMRNQFYIQAKRRGGKVRVHFSEDGFVIQFYGLSQELHKENP